MILKKLGFWDVIYVAWALSNEIWIVKLLYVKDVWECQFLQFSRSEKYFFINIFPIMWSALPIKFDIVLESLINDLGNFFGTDTFDL